jgi:uncharacterized membrane protein
LWLEAGEGLRGLSLCIGIELEGLEVVFIVVALGAGKAQMLPASAGSVAGCLATASVGLIIHPPLARVPENKSKPY